MEYGPWIAWNGGEPPVHNETKLEIMQSGGTRMATKGGDLQWHHPDSSEWAVIAYREATEPKVYEYEMYWDSFQSSPKLTPYECDKGGRAFTITVQGDTIKAEWSDET